ncbi:CHAP domain-containing protein [Chitinophaga sp. HK235]|uniref:CHAP domain-containing protein n=1 Tax=Chitinophaga sp. HK235 TaxID=2952571 RepID=UPI001BA7FBAA|nr:CHAP domain-containing protein [Chitinophaga sp. HK235]
MAIGLEAMQIALSQEGVREATGKNDGPAVEKYLKSVGLPAGYSWCMAFVYWCVQQAAIAQKVANPLKCTGGVLYQWNERPGLRVQTPAAGDIFIMDYGKGAGHTGFVVAVRGDVIDTIEGNTNSGGSREGDGVYRRTRKIASMKGFLCI